MTRNPQSLLTSKYLSTPVTLSEDYSRINGFRSINYGQYYMKFCYSYCVPNPYYGNKSRIQNTFYYNCLGYNYSTYQIPLKFCSLVNLQLELISLNQLVVHKNSDSLLFSLIIYQNSFQHSADTFLFEIKASALIFNRFFSFLVEIDYCYEALAKGNVHFYYGERKKWSRTKFLPDPLLEPSLN
eukprot:TRINITY_DN2371_c0_g1_i3.p1 TRINITY_DN2371_c0_g1~~TRINITY_DN2371_c0_g1_i3.p1  ORF type:complete len:184 (-),score=9.47 TRINITY_DN2371_c0_g1_i3:73-624(-)